MEISDLIVIIIADIKITLSQEEKQALEIKHSQEKNPRKAHRIKTILLRDEGGSLSRISQASRVHNDVVSGCISDHLNNHNLTFHYQGSKAYLNEEQSLQLIKH